MRLKSQLTSPTVAVDRNVNNTDMDAIRSVNAHIDEIAALGSEETLEDIALLASFDFDTLLATVDTIDNLTVRVVETLSPGQSATAELVGSEIQLRIPKGDSGVTPQYEFVYNPTSGNLECTLTGYIDINTGDIVSITQLDEIYNRISEW